MNDEERRMQRQLEDADNAAEELEVLRSHRTQPAHYHLLKERGYTEDEIEAAYDEVEA